MEQADEPTAAERPDKTPEENGKREAPALPRSPGGLAVLNVLKHREFAIFWAGLAVSMIGTWMQAYAQGWVVTQLTTSAFALGLVNFASSIPTLILMPFGGVAADRVERRKILVYTQWVMLALAAATGVLVATGRLELWHLYAIALLLGVATAYDLPAYQAFYPQLIPRAELTQAIALNQATFHGSRIIGPAVASAFVALWGTAAAFYANAASFLAVLLSLQFIRPRPMPPADRKESILEQMRDGMRYVEERPELQALLGLTGITTFFVFPNMAVLMPHYAQHLLKVGPGGLGTLMSGSGVGSFIGAVMLLSVPRESRVMAISLAAGGLAAMMSVLAWSPNLWVSVPAIALLSVSLSFSVGLASIIIQEEVPDAIRGRVMSLYSLMFTGIMPFAALAITALTDRIGMRIELQAAAICYALGAVLVVLALRRARPGD